ncbi:MAG: phosphatidate cytidylyltransferase [Firmicutes bacterium]|nr:phosphatidate cytidylyltransferase [Bacillota bacterium]
MWLRVLTAAVTLPLFLGALWAGGPVFTGLSALLAGIGFWEYSQMWRRQGRAVPAGLGAALAAALVLTAGWQGPPGLVATLTAAALAILAVQVLGYRRYTAADMGLTLAGVVYVGWLFAHFPLLRERPGDLRPLLFAFLITWVSDTSAYFVGRALGRRKLAPDLSPGKTVAGAAGGMILAALAGALGASSLLAGVAPVDSRWLPALGTALGAVGAAAGLVGDLAESALKRHVGVKDSGQLLPGHGGVLDRFDSALFTVPVVYYALLLLGG